MATPPPEYDEIVSANWRVVEEKKSSPESVRRWNIREVVSSSRTQNVASIVEQLLPQIKTQAERGNAKSELILIPSDEDNARDGDLVGLDTDVGAPLIIQFEGQQNTTSFWSQTAVIAEMKKQLESALIETDRIESPVVALGPIPQKPSRSSSWFSRSTAKGQAVRPMVEPPLQPPVTIQVLWDDLHARKMNDYGLYETKRAGAVFITIHVT